MTAQLGGKVALITGSDSGIGQGTAVEFAKEGAEVVVHYLEDRTGAESTKQQVESCGRRAVMVQADVREETQVERMFDEALQALVHDQAADFAMRWSS